MLSVINLKVGYVHWCFWVFE